MATTQARTKRLRGKYQLTKNTFVTCYLDVLDASENEIKTFIGLSKRGDASVPAGTRIYLNTDAIQGKAKFTVLSITVKEVQELQGMPFMICSGVMREERNELRATPRIRSSFPLLLTSTVQSASFMSKEGTVEGLTMFYTGQRSLLSLTMKHTYNFEVTHKGETYRLPAEVKHIQYDWKTTEHIVGVTFNQLPDQEKTVLNLLLDPTYTVPISDNQTVDTTEGKVSAVLEDEPS